MSAGQNQQSGGAGGGDGLDPTSQAPGWTSGTSIGDSTKLLLAREIVNLLLPTWTSLPIFQPDNSPLTNPGSGTVVWDPGSAGYGAGGKVELPSSTGGSRIDEQGGWSTTTSGDPVAGLGVVHSSANTDGDSGSAEIVIDTKISSQITERGWTEQDIRAVVQAGVIGTAVDKRSASKTPDGLPRNDSASVYGSKEGYVVVNDRTKEVVQISGRNDPGWIPDSRINWR
ncbi:colicin E5-related ribonuclease [Pseudomonas citronellolis]|uniref:colicin E5-related ribonuclease n=1 Tax=Pseudomonas citronellolis TaxID=53408 RepID=UPI003D3418EA